MIFYVFSHFGPCLQAADPPSQRRLYQTVSTHHSQLFAHSNDVEISLLSDLCAVYLHSAWTVSHVPLPLGLAPFIGSRTHFFMQIAL